jgi:hypothetical protein
MMSLLEHGERQAANVTVALDKVHAAQANGKDESNAEDRQPQGRDQSPKVEIIGIKLSQRPRATNR